MSKSNYPSQFYNLIQQVNSWHEIYDYLSEFSDCRRTLGGLFEEFAKYYFLTEPACKAEYKNVWLFDEVPTYIKSKLGLANRDYGTDLILENHLGELSSVQCKFRTNQNSKLFWSQDKLTNFFADSDNADYYIIFSNVFGIDKRSASKKLNRLRFIGLSDLLELQKDTFDNIRRLLSGKETKPLKKQPRDYQLEIIATAAKQLQQTDRGQLILPCGTGKTLISLWVKEELSSKRTIVLVPSLALLRQTKHTWVANQKEFIPYLCICSEKDIDKPKGEREDDDATVMYMPEIGGNVSTDLEVIKSFLLKYKEEMVIYCTYQSLEKLCNAARSIDFKFDLAICDEAHKTAGNKRSKHSLIHSESNIKVTKRLYMTATPRIMSNSVKNNASESIDYLYDMDNKEVFGEELYRMSFGEAIEKGILVDYKVVAIGVDDEAVSEAIKNRNFVSESETIDEIANNYALQYFMDKYEAHHAITFHSLVKKAQDFGLRHPTLDERVKTYHINGGMDTNQRNIILDDFIKEERSIITNARCLTEGVDVPAVDIVYFGDPKNSKVDIVQAVGRALRKNPTKDKKFAYIVLPIFHNKQDDAEEIVESSHFKHLISVIKALSSHDQRIVDEITNLKAKKGQRVVVLESVSTSTKELIYFDGYDEALRNKLFDELLKKVHSHWPPFQEARSYVHKLSIKSQKEWNSYRVSGNRPINIPSNPQQVYKDKGWKDWGDWLGTGAIASQYTDFLPFKEARSYVRKLFLKSQEEWNSYRVSGNRPTNIPSNPHRTYKDKGWISYGDWLGNGGVANHCKQFLPFQEAKVYVHKLSLKYQKEWYAYCASGNRPENIPSNPQQVYNGKGWKDWKDWLGTKQKQFLLFQEARSYVHKLSLKSRKEWHSYRASGNRPKNIPSNPYENYKDTGWISWGDWLGTTTIANRHRNFLPFEEAKSYVHKLSLRSTKEWRAYCTSGNKPENIPTNPNRIYKEKGWVNYGDWLGTGTVRPKDRHLLPFEEARSYVHKLLLKSKKEWQAYSTSGNRPENIPGNPYETYKGKGWISYGDWLGTSAIANQHREFLSFEEAKSYVHKLSLKSQKEWRAYCTSGNKPRNIPTHPDRIYRDKGWTSWGDWLGTGTIVNLRKEFLPFEEARRYVHKLSLKSLKEWKKYAAHDNFPQNTPKSPEQVYKNHGWKGYGDWLGTNRIATRELPRASFEESREYARSLGLKSSKEWFSYCKSGSKPKNIPTYPNETYEGKGWISWPDWLGTDYIAPKDKQFLPFEEAKRYVHKLSLKSVKEWNAYCKSGSKAKLLPTNPNRTYKDKNWVSWEDWLGKDNNKTEKGE